MPIAPLRQVWNGMFHPWNLMMMMMITLY